MPHESLRVNSVTSGIKARRFVGEMAESGKVVGLGIATGEGERGRDETRRFKSSYEGL